MITGGGSGMGLATAKYFAKQGANVFVADLISERVKDAIQQIAAANTGTHAAGMVVDVTDPEAVSRAYRRLCDEFGGVDIVVSNAGIVVRRRDGRGIQAELKKALAVNFYAHQRELHRSEGYHAAPGLGYCLLYSISKAPLNPGEGLGPYVSSASPRRSRS